MEEGNSFLIRLKEIDRDLQKFDVPLSKSDEANWQMANLPLPKSRSDFPDVATEMEEPFKVGTAHSMSLLTEPTVKFCKFDKPNFSIPSVHLCPRPKPPLQDISNNHGLSSASKSKKHTKGIKVSTKPISKNKEATTSEFTRNCPQIEKSIYPDTKRRIVETEGAHGDSFRFIVSAVAASQSRRSP